MEQRCSFCRFWKLTDDDEGVGECRFAPPILQPGLNPMRGFPVTLEDDWCGKGEFE